MGGGLSRHELAAAVSDAGGLGTIAANGAPAIRRELLAARKLTDRPVAMNVLQPLARRDWYAAAAEAEVVLTFWGKAKAADPGVWNHQCGSVTEAQASSCCGRRRGDRPRGGVRRPRAGKTPALELLERVKAALPAAYPLLLAGGIAERGDVQRALDESQRRGRGNPLPALRGEQGPLVYTARLLRAEETLLTELFGAGWPAPPPRGAQRGDVPLVERLGAAPTSQPGHQPPLRAGRSLHALGVAAANHPHAASGQSVALTADRHRRWAGHDG